MMKKAMEKKSMPKKSTMPISKEKMMKDKMKETMAEDKKYSFVEKIELSSPFSDRLMLKYKSNINKIIITYIKIITYLYML